jgi:hypothetical protein
VGDVGGEEKEGERRLIVYIIAIKVQNLMQRGDVDIVNPKWLLACIGEKRIVPFEPKYAFSYPPSTSSS